jgi:hypothetical protein
MAENMSPEYSDGMLEDFCNEIIRCMVLYGGWEEANARALIEASHHCDPKILVTELDRDWLFHDYPYFHALDLIYGRENPQWFNDPALGLWPPPDEYMEYLASHKLPHE